MTSRSAHLNLQITHIPIPKGITGFVANHRDQLVQLGIALLTAKFLYDMALSQVALQAQVSRLYHLGFILLLFTGSRIYLPWRWVPYIFLVAAVGFFRHHHGRLYRLRDGTTDAVHVRHPVIVLPVFCTLPKPSIVRSGHPGWNNYCVPGGRSRHRYLSISQDELTGVGMAERVPILRAYPPIRLPQLSCIDGLAGVGNYAARTAMVLGDHPVYMPLNNRMVRKPWGDSGMGHICRSFRDFSVQICPRPEVHCHLSHSTGHIHFRPAVHSF